ncbi:MAG: GNAT family N-acetyltransferase [Bacteroidota bacterium]
MSEPITIVPYSAAYRTAFKALNQEWIDYYFTMEAEDTKMLDHPDTEIIEKGGYIAVALLEGEAVGVCALLKMEHPLFEYELAKMGVSPKARNRGIGFLLGTAIIDKARELGASQLYLASNAKLGPALRLYRKLGFIDIEGIDSPYERCDVQMSLTL